MQPGRLHALGFCATVTQHPVAAVHTIVNQQVALVVCDGCVEETSMRVSSAHVDTSVEYINESTCCMYSALSKISKIDSDSGCQHVYVAAALRYHESGQAGAETLF